MRFQFPLYKIFLIIATWAAALGAFCHLGAVGIAIAAVIGVTTSLLIIGIRDGKDLVLAVFAAMGSLIGAGFAFMFFSPPLVHHYTVASFVRDCIIVSVGAIIGGVFFSWASKR